MREIKKTIKVPFQRIEFYSAYSSLEKMDELESLLAILIVTSKEEGLKRETLREAIYLKFGVKEQTISIIKNSLKGLIRSGTIEGQEKVSIDDLLDKSIRRVSRKIKKEVTKSVLLGNFLKKSKNKRSFNGRTYENIIEGFKYDSNMPMFSFNEDWKIELLSEEYIKEIADGLAEKQKKSNESLDLVKAHIEKTKIETQEKDIHFKMDKENRLIAINKNATALFSEIIKGNLSIDSLAKLMNTGIDSVEYIENKNGHQVNVKENEIITMLEHSHVIQGSKVYQVFNKKINYIIEGIDDPIKVDEIFGEEIEINELLKRIIATNDVLNLDIWNNIKTSLKEELFATKVSKANAKFYKHLLNKENASTAISEHSDFIKEFYNKDEKWELFKDINKKDILINLENINKVLSNEEAELIYKTLYLKLNMNYGKDTILFPKWSAEKQHNKFINDLESFNHNIELVEVKDEAVKLLSKIGKYNFEPIKSNELNGIKEKIKSLVASKPESPVAEIITNAMKIRLMLESMIKKNQKLTFREALKKAIKNKVIDKRHEGKIYEIYKNSNKYHHESDIELDIKKEKKIKEDIIYIEKIANIENIELNKFKGVFKWATA